MFLHSAFPAYKGLFLLQLQLVQVFLDVDELLLLPVVLLHQLPLMLLFSLLLQKLPRLLSIVPPLPNPVGTLQLSLQVHLPLLLDNHYIGLQVPLRRDLSSFMNFAFSILSCCSRSAKALESLD